MFTFDCRGDFRKDEAALSYGVDHGFREGPNSRLGTDQDQNGTWHNGFRASSGKTTRRKERTGLGRTDFEQVRAKPPVRRSEQGLAERISSKFGQNHPSEGSNRDSTKPDSEQVRAKPPVGRIERGLGRTDFEQVRAKTTRRKDRTYRWTILPKSKSVFLAVHASRLPGGRRRDACTISAMHFHY